ncbi:hypothetical protein AB0H76_15040 [Nocardia sp. NPDC050712]|uniref:hypothetical protein n=1 Tax=Nocardia sp. NPDC050712 TaxID=3155518 RepID=UPI0033C1F7FA
MEELIEASSLGTPEACRLRASVSDEEVAKVVRRADARRVTAHLRDLAERSEAATREPGWPFGGSGDWAGNVYGMLGGEVGEYCAALRPYALLIVLDSLERLTGPCEVYAPGRCTDGLSINSCCKPCIAQGAIEALTSPTPSPRADVAPRGEVARPGLSPGDGVCGPGRAPNLP